MFDYKNIGDKTHLIYTLKDGDQVDDVTKNVLLHNEINGLAPFSAISEDGNERFIYDVSSMVSLHHYLNSHHEDVEVLGFVKNIANISHSVDNYLANSDDIVTGLDYIFINTYSKEVSLILLPITRNNNRAIFGLFEQIAERLDNGEYSVGARLKSVLHSFENFSIEQFITFVDSILQEISGAEAGDKSTDSNSLNAPNGSVNDSPTTVEFSASSPKEQEAQTLVSFEPLTSKPAKERIELTNPATDFTSISEGTALTSEIEKVSLFKLLMHYSKENAMKRKEWKRWVKSQKSGQNHVSSKETDDNHSPNNTVDVKYDFAKPSSSLSSISSISDNDSNVIDGHLEAAQLNENVHSDEVENVSGERKTTPALQSTNKPVGAFGATQFLAPVDDNHGKTTLLVQSDIGDLVDEALVSKSTVFGKLISKADGTEIIINKPSFTIGRADDCVDCVLSSTNVSGVHAVLESNAREQKYYITDTNSRNHVFINGEQITPSEKTLIEEGSVISFADEKYEFRTA